MTAPDPEAGDSSPAAAGAAPLIATPDPACSPRLAAILRMGRRHGLVAILLGDWPGGVTCHVEADGTVTAAVPPHPDFRGLRLFHLTAARCRGDPVRVPRSSQRRRARPQAAAGVAGEPPDDGTDAAQTASGPAEPRRASAQSLHWSSEIRVLSHRLRATAGPEPGPGQAKALHLLPGRIARRPATTGARSLAAASR